MKNLFLSLLALLVITGFSFYSPGGHSLKFNSPGEGFVKSEDDNAYENAEDNAILKGNLVSQDYNAFKSLMEKRLGGIEEITVLSKEDKKVGQHNGYLVKMTRQVDDESEMIALVFLFPAGHGMTGNMTATFPKSMEEKYEEAMLNAMGTAKLVHNH